jgi:hypothetical protein
VIAIHHGRRAPDDLANLAGGNNDALAYTADEMRALAVAAKGYDDVYVVVAD